LILLLHPSICGAAFYHFLCVQVDSSPDATYFLKTDYSIVCYDGLWWGMLPLVLFVGIVVAFGVPASIVFLLQRHRLDRARLRAETREKAFRAYLRVNPSGGGSVTTCEQFVAAMQQQGDLLPFLCLVPGGKPVPQLEFHFDKMDRDGSGHISCDEFVAYVEGGVEQMPDEEQGNAEKKARSTGRSILGCAVSLLARSSRAALAAVLGKQIFAKQRRRVDPRFQDPLGMLAAPYKASCWYFECVQMVFKVMFWVILVFFPIKGSQFQLAAVAILTIVQLMLHARVEPFKKQLANRTEYVGHVVVLLTSLSGLLINYLEADRGTAEARGDTAQENRMAGRLDVTQRAVEWTVGVMLATGVVFVLADKKRYLRMRQCRRGGGDRAAAARDEVVVPPADGQQEISPLPAYYTAASCTEAATLAATSTDGAVAGGAEKYMRRL
jgi:hypothetical protein